MRSRRIIPVAVFAICVICTAYSFNTVPRKGYAVEAYMSRPLEWGEGHRRLEMKDTVSSLQWLNVYYTREHFHMPDALPAQLLDTSRASDTLQLAGGNGYLAKKEIMMVYDKTGMITLFANYGCLNCPIQPYEYSFEYDPMGNPVRIVNSLGKKETYTFIYAAEGYLKRVDKSIDGKTVQRVELDVKPVN